MDQCSVCSRVDRSEVDAALDAYEGINATARRFSISSTTLKRHAKHRSGKVALSKGDHPADAPVDSDGGLLEYVAELAASQAPSPPPRGPGQQCQTCASRYRSDIERRLIAGDSSLSIERAFAPDGPSDQSIRHHARRCIPLLLASGKNGAREELVSSLKERCESLMGKAERLVHEAEGNGVLCMICQAVAGGSTVRDRAASITAAKGVLELLAKLLGELGADVEVRVVLDSPRFALEKDAILAALAPYPEAAIAVTSALRSLPAGRP